MSHELIYLFNTLWLGDAFICMSKLTIIGSDNGLVPGRHQAIIWTNAGILLIGPLGTNYSQILIEIHIFSFKKMHWKMSSGKCLQFCLGLNVLTLKGEWDFSGSHLPFWIRWLGNWKQHFLSCSLWDVAEWDFFFFFVNHHTNRNIWWVWCVLMVCCLFELRKKGIKMLAIIILTFISLFDIKSNYIRSSST